MLTTNHKQPEFTYSARLPWRRRLRALAPCVGGTGILYTYRDSGGAAWWSDGTAIFRGDAPDYLRRAYLHAGLPVDTPLASLPLSPIEALALLGPRLDEPVACYRITAGSLDSIPVDVFATDDPVFREIHIDARYVSHATGQFPDCSFWRLDDIGIAVRDRYGFQIVGLIQRRPPPPEDVHRGGTAL